jgi:hypothetical protein
MKKILSVLTVLIFLSCTTKKDIYMKPTYINKDGYKNFYIIDTIKIDNPIRFFTVSGSEFVMSQKNFETFSGKWKDYNFYEQQSIFLVVDEFPKSRDFPSELETVFRAKGISICYDFNYLLLFKKKGIIDNAYTFQKQPDFFLLVLIRDDFYNLCYTGLDGRPSIALKKNGFWFYRLVIPCCRS